MTLSWLGKIDDLRVEALAARRGHAVQLAERAAFKAFKTRAGFRFDGEGYVAGIDAYVAGLRAYVSSLPPGSSKLPEVRVRGFKVILTLDELEPGRWAWTCSMSGSGSPADRDAILRRLGCPEEVAPGELAFSTQWCWPAAAGDVPA